MFGPPTSTPTTFLYSIPPTGCGEISSVAVGPGGTLYVFHKDGTANGNMGGHKIKVYDRDGKHLKVVAPFPADLAAEKLKGVGVFQTATGELVPHVHVVVLDGADREGHPPPSRTPNGNSSGQCTGIDALKASATVGAPTMER